MAQHGKGPGGKKDWSQMGGQGDSSQKRKIKIEEDMKNDPDLADFIDDDEDENGFGQGDQVETEAQTEPEETHGALEHPSYKELEDKLTTAEQRAEKFWNEVLRTQADLENVKRRASKDVENAHKFAIEKFVLELLPVIDSLEAGFDLIMANKNTENAKVIEGIELTLKMFMGVLGKFEVKQIDPLGQPFDPAYHEAMSMQETDEAEPNTVIKVFQKGYTLYGRLVRPAMVVVAK